MANEADLLVARRTARKVEAIVQKTYDEFIAVSAGYGTLSADELLACGIALFMNVAAMPLERMAADKRQMRRQIIWELQKVVKQGTNRMED